MNIRSNRILELLAENKMTQTRLAEKSGLSKQAVSSTLRRRTCAPLTAGKLAEALGVSVTEIMREA